MPIIPLQERGDFSSEISIWGKMIMLRWGKMITQIQLHFHRPNFRLISIALFGLTDSETSKSLDEIWLYPLVHNHVIRGEGVCVRLTSMNSQLTYHAIHIFGVIDHLAPQGWSSYPTNGGHLETTVKFVIPRNSKFFRSITRFGNNGISNYSVESHDLKTTESQSIKNLIRNMELAGGHFVRSFDHFTSGPLFCLKNRVQGTLIGALLE